MAQRYDIWIYYDSMETDKDDNGDWVKHEDHASELTNLRAENERLRVKLGEIVATLDGEPEYHYQGMGCGLEDRNITDRYDAMKYGWDQAMDRIYSEHINHALDLAKEALK